MHPLLKLLIRFAIVFTVIFIAVQPYNWFCGITQKCDSFHFSYLIPKREGHAKYNFQFNVTNFNQNLNFEVLDKSLTTVSGRRNVIHYRVKNISKKTIYLRSKLEILPADIEKYLKIYDCLCTKVYKLKRGEERDLKMTFELKSSIDDDKNSQSLRQGLMINYSVKPR